MGEVSSLTGSEHLESSRDLPSSYKYPPEIFPAIKWFPDSQILTLSIQIESFGYESGKFLSHSLHKRCKHDLPYLSSNAGSSMPDTRNFILYFSILTTLSLTDKSTGCCGCCRLKDITLENISSTNVSLTLPFIRNR